MDKPDISTPTLCPCIKQQPLHNIWYPDAWHQSSCGHTTQKCENSMEPSTKHTTKEPSTISMTTVLEKWCEFFTHFPFFRCIGTRGDSFF